MCSQVLLLWLHAFLWNYFVMVVLASRFRLKVIPATMDPLKWDERCVQRKPRVYL